MPKGDNSLRLDEIGNTYVGARDRFVVSLVVGYAANDGVHSVKDAAAAALSLIQEGDCGDTHWYVYDRETKELHLLEQSEFADHIVGFSEDDEECR